MRALLIPFFLVLAGCVDSTTYLKNVKTGEVVKCGGSHALTVMEFAIKDREAKCIDDYKEQGFIRVPGPK